MKHPIFQDLIEREMQMREEHHYFPMLRTRPDRPFFQDIKSSRILGKNYFKKKKQDNNLLVTLLRIQGEVKKI